MAIHPLTWAAIAAWSGAVVSWPVPVLVGPCVIALGLRSGRTVVACVGLLVLTSSLAARTTAGLPVERAEFDGEVTLVSDPERFGPSVRADVRVEGRRIEAWARGPDGAALSARLAGERVRVVGQIGPPPPHATWLARRHVVGRMTVSSVGAWRRGDPASTAANGLRRTLVAGSESMDPERRSLYVGLLLGDQREQQVVVADAFRGSGLTHLLAVSGQNVAFVLVLVGPLLRRLRFGPRLLATLVVLAFFALVTRFEPSVLRATTMAACAAMAVTFGREADSRRMIALAVILLVAIDPMIVDQLAFQLSVVATVGILLWGTSIARAVPGPGVLASAIGVTVAAQAAVSPLLIPSFGGMPVAALVANVLAAPVAGPVVMWGLPAGVVAGMVGGGVAEVLHLPTALLVGWIGGVAERCATLPLGEVRTPHLIVALGGVGLMWLARQVRGVPVLIGIVFLVGALLHPALVMQSGPPPVTTFSDGSRLHVAGDASVLVVDVGARPDLVLEGLRRAGVRRVDIVVALHGGLDVAETVAALRHRSEPRLVLAPSGHRVPLGSVARAGSVVSVGRIDLRVVSVGSRLEVDVTMTGQDRARGPPV